MSGIVLWDDLGRQTGNAHLGSRRPWGRLWQKSPPVNELYNKSGKRQASQDVKVRDKVEKILDLECTLKVEVTGLVGGWYM